MPAPHSEYARQSGPCPVELLIAEAHQQFGFSRAEVLEAAKHWNFTTEEDDRVLYWIKPACLVPLARWIGAYPDGRSRMIEDHLEEQNVYSVKKLRLVFTIYEGESYSFRGSFRFEPRDIRGKPTEISR